MGKKTKAHSRWTYALHATAPSFSGYPGLRPWLIRVEATLRSPHTHWIDVVRRDLDQLGLDAAANESLAQYSDEWRALVNLVSSTHNAPRGTVQETR